MKRKNRALNEFVKGFFVFQANIIKINNPLFLAYDSVILWKKYLLFPHRNLQWLLFD
jgi:hypothetical protein